MKIAVLGATGGLGTQVVRAALDAGHTVTAYARTPSKLGDVLDQLTVVQGDLDDADALRDAIDHSDAVLSAVGLTRGQAPEIFGRGMSHVISAMQASGVQRLVAISGAGLELEGDHTGLGRRVIICLLELFARDVLRGKQLEADTIRASDRDWTLVRVARMVDRPATGAVQVDPSRVSGSPMVAYADVASWMVAEVERCEHVRGAPFLSGA